MNDELSNYFAKLGRKGSRKRWSAMTDKERKATMEKVRAARAAKASANTALNNVALSIASRALVRVRKAAKARKRGKSC